MAENANFIEVPEFLDTPVPINATPAVDFITGFLKGIGEEKSIENLLKCIEDLEKIWKNILEALEHLKKMTFQEIVKGLTMLFAAVKELMNMITPCTEGYEKLKKLIYEIAHPDIMKIAMRIMMHPAEFIADITKAINCFKSLDYKCAGEAVGDLLRIMFLTRQALRENEALEFIKGFLKGIGEEKGVENLVKCIKELEAIFKEILEALEHLKKMTFSEIVKGLTMLFNAVKKFMAMISPCTEGYEKLKKLIYEIAHPDIMKIAMRIMMHPAEFIADITKAISCFGSLDYNCAGQAVGDLLRIMFLTREALQDDPALEFIKGFLKGIGEEKGVENLVKCIKELEKIWDEILEALEHLKKMTFAEIVKGLTMLFNAVKEFMAMLTPCTEGYEKLKKLIYEIAHPDIMKIAMRIMMHPAEFIADITKAISCFQSLDYNCAGQAVGDLLRIMFLTRQAFHEENAIEFIKGFLKGIGEEKDIENLLKCIKSLEAIFAKIVEALEHLKKMTFQEIVKGLTMLFNAVKEFIAILTPCMEGHEKLKKLIYEISHPDIMKIAMRIMMHPAEFIADITKAISCFQSKSYNCAGEATGDLLRIMFLTRQME